jgi:hypothetical protein
MGDHSDRMMGACLALLMVAGLTFLLGEPLVLPIPLPSGRVHSLIVAVGILGPTERSPPEEGTVLLM